jgi:hypothetical protein
MTQVIVYKNLRLGTWSIAELKGSSTRGRVIAHRSVVTLRNVRFHVSEARRQAVIRARCREVHAFAIGELVEAAEGLEGERVTYCPYRGPSFTLADGRPIAEASAVQFRSNGSAYVL